LSSIWDCIGFSGTGSHVATKEGISVGSIDPAMSIDSDDRGCFCFPRNSLNKKGKMSRSEGFAAMDSVSLRPDRHAPL
jgi:hypothetical protein